jgi:hypothetical protein
MHDRLCGITDSERELSAIYGRRPFEGENLAGEEVNDQLCMKRTK